MKRIAALAAALLMAFAAPTAAASPPTATVIIESTCSGWSVTVDYANFSYGDVFVAGYLLPGMPGSDGFWNLGEWTGSGRMLAVVGTGPASDIKVMVDINPFGPIDPATFTVPIGNVVGNQTIDDHPTVTEATLDTSACAPVASSFVLLAPSTDMIAPLAAPIAAPAATPPPTATAPAPAQGGVPAFPLALLAGVLAALLVTGKVARARR
jgi:hypothetical protein